MKTPAEKLKEQEASDFQTVFDGLVTGGLQGMKDALQRVVHMNRSPGSYGDRI